jgi:hypothetical protein
MIHVILFARFLYNGYYISMFLHSSHIQELKGCSTNKREDLWRRSVSQRGRLQKGHGGFEDVSPSYRYIEMRTREKEVGL